MIFGISYSAYQQVIERSQTTTDEEKTPDQNLVPVGCPELRLRRLSLVKYLFLFYILDDK